MIVGSKCRHLNGSELCFTGQTSKEYKGSSARVSLIQNQFLQHCHYLLSELSLKEAKAIIQQAMCEEATDAAVAQIYALTGGVHRHVDMIIPRIFHLMELNRKALAEGKIKMQQLIALAGARLMVG